MAEYALREYQQQAIDDLFDWVAKKQGYPILELACGAGKSVVIAGIVKRLFNDYPDDHPRTLVIVPSKELAEQNAEKLAAVVPDHISLGYYSASVGKKEPDKDVIVATIGSVAKVAHLLGHIRCVIFDECHMVSTKNAGQYRNFLNDLAKYCKFFVCGLTGTPYRGNGVWLTDGEDPLFSGIAHKTTIADLLEQGYLKPLVRPSDIDQQSMVQIDTSDVSMSYSNGVKDFNVAQLSEKTDKYLSAIADDTVRLCVGRKKIIGFTPNVATAHHLSELLNERGIITGVVTGSTPKAERVRLISEFRAGKYRCLVTVLALTVGFDAPDIDAILWVRSTVSPLVYVQGGGRGFRITPHADDCLWCDWTTTTATLGPIDGIKGRAAGKKVDGSAPFAVCDNCAAQVRPASLKVCPQCGHTMREDEDKKEREVSDAPVLTSQVKPKIFDYLIDNVQYSVHRKIGGQYETLRVSYYSGLSLCATEWVCLSHPMGFAKTKARKWWNLRHPDLNMPGSVQEAISWISQGLEIRKPYQITVDERTKYPEIIGYQWEPINEMENENDTEPAF